MPGFGRKNQFTEMINKIISLSPFVIKLVSAQHPRRVKFTHPGNPVDTIYTIVISPDKISICVVYQALSLSCSGMLNFCQSVKEAGCAYHHRSAPDLLLIRAAWSPCSVVRFRPFYQVGLQVFLDEPVPLRIISQKSAAPAYLL